MASWWNVGNTTNGLYEILVVFTILESYMKAFRPSLPSLLYIYPSIFHILEKQERWTTLEIKILLDMYKHIKQYQHKYIYIYIYQKSTISIVRQKKHDSYICAGASKVIIRPTTVSSLRSWLSFNHVGVCEEHWFANKDVCWAFVGRSPSSSTWSASRYTCKSNMKVEHGIFGITPKKCYMTGQNHVHSRFCVCCVCVCAS